MVFTVKIQCVSYHGGYDGESKGWLLLVMSRKSHTQNSLHVAPRETQRDQSKLAKQLTKMVVTSEQRL